MLAYYDSEVALNEYLWLHYGELGAELNSLFTTSLDETFPKRCVKTLLDSAFLDNTKTSALDLGCAVGGASFELTFFAAKVIGIDSSQTFIDTANKLKISRTVEVILPEEGEIKSVRKINLGAEVRPENVNFVVGDALNLPNNLGQFDIVCLFNLLCRLPNPQALLARLKDLVKPGGQLLISTPCTWLENYTPKENWLGGYLKNGEKIHTLDTLKYILRHDFEIKRTHDLPFLLRNHSRKYELVISQASAWTRKTTE